MGSFEIRQKCKQIIPDALFLRMQYLKYFRRWPRLRPSLTMNEYLLWRKLYDHDPRYTAASDKYRVRQQVEQLAGPEVLVPLLAVHADVDEIDVDALPKSFIIKTNHGYAQNLIVRDKATLDWGHCRATVKQWLGENFYEHSRQWQYKYIKPLVLVEKLLVDEQGALPNDYKLHCFNGRVGVIAVVHNRENHATVSFYNRDWEYLAFEWGDFPMGPKEPAPHTLPALIKLAETLSADYHYVRVDLYSLEGQVFFGELTFTPMNGLAKFQPAQYDQLLGAELSCANSGERFGLNT